MCRWQRSEVRKETRLSIPCTITCERRGFKQGSADCGPGPTLRLLPVFIWHKLATVSTFLNDRVGGREYFMTHEKYMKFTFVSINKVLWKLGPTRFFLLLLFFKYCLWLFPCCKGRIEPLQQRSCDPESLKHLLFFLFRVC